jgi:hypothetical protein
MSDQVAPQEAQAQYHEPLSSELRPKTDATLTIRIIKSFEFRTQKSMVIKGVNLDEETVGGLMQRVRDCKCSQIGRISSLLRGEGWE